jgi:UDP-N-acetylmuramate: L-alanyl-gamma-D-glutamyl-meso-diaminopimelate ligase
MAKRAGSGSVIAVIEPRSNSMRAGVHADQLPAATRMADYVFWYQPPGLDGSLERIVTQSQSPSEIVSDINELALKVAAKATAGDSVVIMSNGGFGGFHELLLDTLEA